MLELTKAATFFASILSLYWAALGAFFIPGLHWQERLFLALARLCLAAAVCLLSGLLLLLTARFYPPKIPSSSSEAKDPCVGHVVAVARPY